MSEDPSAARRTSPPPTDPAWRAMVEMADHALDPDVDEDSSLAESDLPSHEEAERVDRD